METLETYEAVKVEAEAIIEAVKEEPIKEEPLEETPIDIEPIIKEEVRK